MAQGHFDGHDKEPSQPHGPKDRVRAHVHSHSARPKRKILAKRGGKKALS